MEIETERLKFTELSLLDASRLAEIAEEMAWNDTINVLLKNGNPKSWEGTGEEELFGYREKVVAYAEKQRGKKLEAFDSDDYKRLYKVIPKSLIPTKNWHINYSLMKPDFKLKSLDFVKGAAERRQKSERRGYWLGIRDKASGRLIGATAISAVEIKGKDGVMRVGHSGQFIHPDFQRKGYISETKAVMADFMYKYLNDMQVAPISENAMFYTTCDRLNEGSQRLQAASGANCITETLKPGEKLEFYASREQIQNSKIARKNVMWRARLDDGKTIFSQTGKADLKMLYSINQLNVGRQNGR